MTRVWVEGIYVFVCELETTQFISLYNPALFLLHVVAEGVLGNRRYKRVSITWLAAVIDHHILSSLSWVPHHMTAWASSWDGSLRLGKLLYLGGIFLQNAEVDTAKLS